MQKSASTISKELGEKMAYQFGHVRANNSFLGSEEKAILSYTAKLSTKNF